MSGWWYISSRLIGNIFAWFLLLLRCLFVPMVCDRRVVYKEAYIWIEVKVGSGDSGRLQCEVAGSAPAAVTTHTLAEGY